MQNNHDRFHAEPRTLAVAPPSPQAIDTQHVDFGVAANLGVEADLAQWFAVAEDPASANYQLNPLESDVRELGSVTDAEPTEGVSSVCEFLHVYQYAEQKDWHLQPRAHSHHELVIVREGVLLCQTGGTSLRVTAGQVLLLPPAAVYAQCADEGPVRLLSIGMRWNGYCPGMPTLVLDDKGRMGELAEWLLTERHASFQDAVSFRAQLLRAMVCEYLRLSEASGWEPQQLNPEHPVVRTVLEYIRSHLSDHFTLDDLAAQAKMSKFYFARAYRALTGLSPMDHARLIRLEAARELLLTTSLPLKSIAPKVGFASEFHLSRLLRTRLGVGARQIRSRIAG